MNIDNMLEIAKTSKNLDELRALLHIPSLLVRRALARNNHIDTHIANTLAYDPVLNVSYMAVKNPNCTIKRDFEMPYSRCVDCLEDERVIKCNNCKNRFDYVNSL